NVPAMIQSSRSSRLLRRRDSRANTIAAASTPRKTNASWLGTANRPTTNSVGCMMFTRYRRDASGNQPKTRALQGVLDQNKNICYGNARCNEVVKFGIVATSSRIDYASSNDL